MYKKIIIGVIIIILLTILTYSVTKVKNNEIDDNNIVLNDNDFNANFIKLVNKEENYLVSPYSALIALHMLQDGSSGDTKEEIDKVIGNSVINNIAVKDKISVVNACFIKNSHKKEIKNTYTNHLKKKYAAEIIFDEFNNPKVINDWAKKNTNGMIEKIIDNLTPNFVMGLANAIALDVKWDSAFTCDNTYSEDFTKINKEVMKSSMMHQYYDYPDSCEYLNNDEFEGIVIPYEKMHDSDLSLEFIGLMPKKGINNYINDLTSEKLKKIKDGAIKVDNKLHISLALPRFGYEASLEDFIDILKNLGIKKAFDSALADFSEMSTIPLYVSDAVHKTKIELTESGTKAAAVTYFSLDEKSMLIEKEVKKIVFNKPFIYMIRDSKTGEIIFFGSVYEPEKWSGSTCLEG